MVRISIATTCKGRLHHLQRALPTFLGQACPVSWEVVLVDFGCPDRAGDWAEAWAGEHDLSDRLRVIRPRNSVDHFHVARAKNIGGIHASGEFVVFADCDLLLPPTFATEAYELMRSDGLDLLLAAFGGQPVACDPPNTHYEFPDQEAEAHSFIVPTFRRQVFLQLRGHDEAFTGWGLEDADLNYRARSLGHTWAAWRPAVKFLNHGAEDSVRFFPDGQRDKGESIRNHMALGGGTLRTVNPGPWGLL